MRIAQFISGEAVDRLTDVLLLIGLDGSILDANTAALDCYGYSLAEMLSLSIRDVTAPEDRSAVEDQMRRAAENGVLFEALHRRSDGTCFPVEVRSARVGAVGDSALLSFVRDISDRKRAEAAMAQLVSRNRTLLQTATDGIHVLDLRGDVVEANPAFCTMLGYTRDELLQLNVADWDAQWSRDELLAKIRELIAHPAVFETRHRRKDGSFLDVEISGVGLALDGEQYLYVSARDVTERKLADAQRVGMRSILAMLDIPGYALDREFRFTALSDAFCDVYEHSYGVVPGIGESFFQGVTDARERAAINRDFEKALAGETMHDVGWRGPVGERRQWTVTRSPLRHGGRVEGVVSFGVDTTERALQEIKVAERARMLGDLVDEARDAVLVVDTQGVVLQCNPAAERLVGRSESQLVGTAASLLAPAGRRGPFGINLASVLGGDRVEVARAEVQGESGETTEVSIRLFPLRDPEGTVIGASVALRPANIDAFYDSLTGLCNRHGFYEFGEHALLYARRADQCAAALVANVDGLSRINEAFGQLVGDVALQDVAAILRDAMREADIIARLGSDEFAVLALGADEEEIEALVDRFLAGVQHFNATGGRPYRLAVSCGVGVRRAGSGDLGSILEDADSRMHEEKRRRAT